MNVIRTIMNVLPEKQKEVLQTLLSLVALPEKEKGCRSYGIYSDIEDDNVFNLISEWDTHQHLDQHMQSNGFSVLLGTKSLLCEPPQIEIHTVSHSEGMEVIYATRNKRS